jgi:outer membrane receptor for ferrienterochelin and colicin
LIARVTIGQAGYKYYPGLWTEAGGVLQNKGRIAVIGTFLSGLSLSAGHAQIMPAVTGQSNSVESDAAEGSTIVYPASYFAPFSPNSVSDMLDRIPGVSLGGGGGGRGLGTGGDLLINGQRLAGKNNSPRAQLDRIPAAEVERIEIIRGTGGELAVRGAGQIINIVLIEAISRSNTSVELIARLNHDNKAEGGATLSHSRQIGNFQTLLSLQSRPNYENRDHREIRYSPTMEPLGTLFETTIRDQDIYEIRSNSTYSRDAQRMQFNLLYSDASHPRRVRRDFVDFISGLSVLRAEEESTEGDYFNWEVGGDYEYRFANDHRFQFLFIANSQTRDDVRERFSVEAPLNSPLRNKTLYSESNRRTREQIVQSQYSMPLSATQDLRIGAERADTRLDSSLFIGNPGGTLPPSGRYGGLPPRPDLSNAGTHVQEIRYEGFLFHNWTINARMTLESSLVYETSEISQSGVVENSRRFDFIKPAVDYRFNLTDALRLRATIARTVSQLSFANFAATANNDDRERDADAGNPELVPQKETRFEIGFEYRLPDDNGVLNTRFFYTGIDDYIGNINATVNPARPISAVGNVGSAARWGMFSNASVRLSFMGFPDAIVSAGLNAFDSRLTDPFLGTERRINRRGEADLGFRHDVTALSLSYGINYRYPFHGGEYDVDITTITRTDSQSSLNLFVSKVFFDDITFRLESDNTLNDSRCRERRRYTPTTINGNLRLIEDSCSSRYRRLTLLVQTSF